MADGKLPTDKHVSDGPKPSPADLQPASGQPPRQAVPKVSPIEDAVRKAREKGTVEPAEEANQGWGSASEQSDEGTVHKQGEPVGDAPEGAEKLESPQDKTERLRKEGIEETLEEAQEGDDEELEDEATTEEEGELEAHLFEFEDGLVYNEKLGRWTQDGKIVATPDNAGERLEALSEHKRELAEAAEASETEGETEGEGEEGEEGEFHLVELPPRREGEDPFELEVSDPEAVERINQLKNGYMRGQDYYQKVDEVNEIAADFEEVKTNMATDPAGWMVETIPAEIRADAALRLLADDETYRSVVPELNKWVKNPEARDVAREKYEARAEKRRAKHERTSHTKQQTRQAAKEVRLQMYDLIPENADPADAQFFMDHSIQTLREIVQQRGQIISPDEVPGLLGDVYRRAFGSPLPSSNGQGGNGRANRPRVKVPAGESQRRSESSAADGERFRQKVRTKRRVSSSAPAGAGSGRASESLRPKEGETLDQALDRAKQLAAAGHLKFS